MEAFASDVPDIVRLVVLLVTLSEVESPVSSAAARSSAAGALTVVSIVMLSAADDPEVLPAVSVATAVTACVLFADSDTSIVHAPEPLAVVEPLLPSWSLVRVMVSLASDVPDIVRLVVLDVMLSELDEPVSSDASRSNASGVFMEVSIVILSAADETEVLPAVSVAVAVTACVRLAVSDISIVQLPEPLAVVVPLGPS